ncbi:diguanylate cyclase/phosphodiesterase (GGDEF & EAL domains) with PAS/PAC sensor(s) [Pseudoalteromonas luteoviolacea B = ATCC 29581]|nr:diguanylate cyclase/phosphodiesterase (GGDEF & EAL domains) with PAS/PAC sensor(s) [Pseudoalteromonas luteoviolacea B = ATCC 29581]
MSKIKATRIRIWLPASILAFLLALMGVVVWLTYSAQTDMLLAQSERNVVNTVSSLARDIERQIQKGEHLEAERLFKLRSLDTHFDLLIGIDESGIVRFSSKSRYSGLYWQSISPIIEAKYLEQAQVEHFPSTHITKDFSSITAYFPYASKRLGEELRPTQTGVVFAYYSLSNDLGQIKRNAIEKSAFIFVFICIIVSFIAVFVHFYLLHPIAQLIKATKSVTDKDTMPTLEVNGSGEFGELAKNFNVMTQTLSHQMHALHEAKEHSLEEQALLESFLDAIPDLFFVVTEDSTIIQFHSSNIDALYLQPDEFLNKKMTEVLPANLGKRFDKTIKECLKYKRLVEFQYELAVTDDMCFFEARLSPIHAFDKVAIVVRDITAQKKQDELIFKHAFYDALTNLPNRYLVLERLSQMILEAKRYKVQIAVMFIDLDDFKKVNDSAGHETGDKLLIEASSRLKAALREEDTVARLGGDEFIILLKSLQDPSQVTPIANNLVKLFQNPFCIDNKEFSVSMSLGIAMYPNDASTPRELLSKADSAMYNAKHQGRNTFSFYTEQMSEILARRLQIEAQMQNALSKDEFTVHFQPQYDLKTKHLLGAEALLRWQNATLGNVRPDEFIPIAEQNGCIVEIGKYVLETALYQARLWQKQLNFPIRIAINLSPRQFRDVRLLHYLEELMHQNINPKVAIELEITEGLLLSGDESVRNTLYQLHNFGFLLSMDDFGTGYSSLSYLRQYPFDVLKIDRAFIQDMDRKEGKALVSAIINMAHTLELKVVAEGIETQTQIEQLEDLKCDVGQGYYLGKPMTAESFSALVAGERCITK